MSKADKEKIKKEEQERKALEEEALRLKAMEDEKNQRKEAEAAAVERAKFENQERKIRREDMTELQNLIDSNQNALIDLDKNRRVQAKWARYMRCDGSPDPSDQGQINTYINLKLEDNSRDDAVSVLKDSLMDLSLIEELQFLLEDTPESDLNESERALYNSTINELQKLMVTKLDSASLQVLCDATKLSNPETNNLEHCVNNDQISLCVWGNLTKNPRIRQFEFSSVHLTFDIPKVLSLSDCAVRVLITKYDHLSQTSKAAAPRRKKKEIVVPEVVEEEKKEEEPVEEEKKDEEEGEKEETEVDLFASLREDDEEEKPAEEEKEVVEEDFEDPTTPEPPEWEDFDEEDDVVDLRANHVLGGLLRLHLLHLPPQPKAAGAWTITQLVDPPEVALMDYVADPTPTEAQSKDKDAKKDEKPPIHVSMTLPKDVLFLEEPQVAHWDARRQFWTTKDVHAITYNEDARSLSFKTNRFGTMCLLQDSHINMPFQSWELRPHGVNSAVLSIIAAIVEIEIEIKDALCCLTAPKDKPELESIRGRWVTPSQLMVLMKKAGVNVFPSEDSSKYVGVQNKNKESPALTEKRESVKEKKGKKKKKKEKEAEAAVIVEEKDKGSKTKKKHPLILQRTYQQMALTASAMAYSWSKWNGETEREQIVFQASEALEDEPLLEEDWWVVLATKKRVSKLKMTEFDDHFNPEMLDGRTFLTPKQTKRQEKHSSSSEGAHGSGSQSSQVTPRRSASSLQSSMVSGPLKSISVLNHQASLAKGGRSSGHQSISPVSTHAKSSAAGGGKPVHPAVKGKKDFKKKGKGLGLKQSEIFAPTFDQTFDLSKSLYKSNLYHLMREVTSETARQRVQDSHFQFTDCVYQLLKATQVLTYAWLMH